MFLTVDRDKIEKPKSQDPFRDQEYANITWINATNEMSYSEEFISKCVKFSEQYSISIASIKFGVREEKIRNWKKKLRASNEYTSSECKLNAVNKK